MTINNFSKFVVSILLSQSAGFISSFFTVSAINNWYFYLEKPTLSPPNWLFGPVWIILYFFIGVSFFIIWKKEEVKKRTAVKIFFLQLLLNASWSILFFGLQSPLLGLINIILLWITIMYMIILFYKISRKTAYLLLPYILWVSFAAYLNWAIWMLN